MYYKVGHGVQYADFGEIGHRSRSKSAAFPVKSATLLGGGGAAPGVGEFSPSSTVSANFEANFRPRQVFGTTFCIGRMDGGAATPTA